MHLEGRNSIHSLNKAELEQKQATGADITILSLVRQTEQLNINKSAPQYMFNNYSESSEPSPSSDEGHRSSKPRLSRIAADESLILFDRDTNKQFQNSVSRRFDMTISPYKYRSDNRPSSKVQKTDLSAAKQLFINKTENQDPNLQ